MPTFTYDGFPVSGLNLTPGSFIFDAQNQIVTGTSSQNTFNVIGVTSYIDGNTFDLGSGTDTFHGSDQAETVFGGSDVDTLNGGGGADTLRGEAGADEINGGDGNDVIHTGVMDGAIDLINGGGGDDTVVYGGFDLDGLLLNGAQVEQFDAQNQVIAGTSGANVFNMSSLSHYIDGNTFDLKGGADSFTGSNQAEIVYGGTGVDTLNGGRGADTLRGEAGADVINGGKGADVIHTGVMDGAIDVINGGGGDDTVVYGGFDLDGLTLTGAAQIEGLDAQNQVITGTSAGNVFDVSGVQSYIDGNTFDLRAGADSFTGSDQAEIVYGGTDVDTLNGGGGADTLRGEAGADEINGGDGHDVIHTGVMDGAIDVINGGDGDDTVVYGGFDLDGLTLTGAAQIEGLDAQNQVITGTSAGNVFDVSGVQSYIDGKTFDLKSGADSFTGSDQAEIVYGGTGVDTLNGGRGADTLRGEEGADVIKGGKGADVIHTGVMDGAIDLINGGGGDDTVVYGGFDLDGLLLNGSKVEQFNAQNQVIDGTSDANVFNMSSLSLYLDGNTFDLKGGADSFIGSDQVEIVYGGTGEDTLNGGRGADTLRGEEGADVINGGKGADVIHTGVMDGAIDVINGGDGDDTVIYGGFDLDGLMLKAAAGIEAFDALNQVIDGTSGGNVFNLSGVQSYTDGNTFELKSGADKFIGSNQAEIVYGGTGEDTLKGAKGHDELSGGGEADLLEGGKGYDTLNGGLGNDALAGQKGRDVLTGGGGDDLLSGGGGADRFVFDDNWGADTISDFAAGDSEDIDLSAVSGIADFTDLITNHLRAGAGGFAEIFDDTDSVLLDGVSLGDIGNGQLYSDSDFIF